MNHKNRLWFSELYSLTTVQAISCFFFFFGKKGSHCLNNRNSEWFTINPVERSGLDLKTMVSST